MRFTPRVDRAGELVTMLLAATVPATLNPAGLLALAPAVLIGPPVLTLGTYAGPMLTWRLLAVAGGGALGATAWAQLDELVDQLWDLLPIERAEPTSFQHPNGDAVPAYALTFTE